VRQLECSLWFEMNREAKLITKLLRKIAGQEAIHDAVNKLVTMFVTDIAMF
jgi:hypothetical protein